MKSLIISMSFTGLSFGHMPCRFSQYAPKVSECCELHGLLGSSASL